MLTLIVPVEIRGKGTPGTFTPSTDLGTVSIPCRYASRYLILAPRFSSMTILEPANVPLAGIPAPAVALVILAAAILLFSYVMFRRIQILRVGMPDPRFSSIGERIRLMLVYGFGQWRQPRYLGAGILHILLFAGFMILSLRSLTLIGRGFSSQFHLPLLTGSAAFSYEVLKDYVVLMVLAVCIVAIVRRAVFHPARYEHNHGGGHENEAYVILGLVAALMVTDMIFDGSALKISGRADQGGLFPAATLAGLFMSGAVSSTLNGLHVAGYWSHILVFFGLLNYLPVSKHFHVITAIPNVFFANLNRGAIKARPLRSHGLDGSAGMRCRPA